MKPTDEELRELQELALKAKAEEVSQKPGQLSLMPSSGGVLNAEMSQHKQHLDMHTEHAEKQAKLFVAHCKELVALGATSVMMFGCQATFERK